MVAVTVVFCRAVMAMALVAVTVPVVARVVPVSAAVVEMVRAKPTGAACTALAEVTTTSPLTPTVTPRLAKNSRNLSTARLTRFCAASSLMPSVAPTVRRSWFLK